MNNSIGVYMCFLHDLAPFKQIGSIQVKCIVCYYLHIKKYIIFQMNVGYYQTFQKFYIESLNIVRWPTSRRMQLKK